MLKKLFNRKPSNTPDIDSNAIPKHVAIIMDGNGRWAKRRGMPRSMGHRAGADVLKQIVIAPWDKTMIGAIEKAILQSDLGLNPGNDGAQIRLTIPQLTEERRKEIVKVVHKKAEDAKVAVRNIRRDVNDALKKEEKAKTITEDDAKDGLDQIQKLTDAKIKQIDELKAVKEKDVLEV